MNVNTELDRLFAQVFPEIPKPEPLEPREPKFCMVFREVSLDEVRAMYPPIDPVDADEAVHGVCAQGDHSDDA